MKKFFRGMLCIMLGIIVALMPIGCAQTDDEDGKVTTTQGTTSDTTEGTTTEKSNEITVSEKYMPDALRNEVGNLLRYINPYDSLKAPYAIQDIFGVSGGKLTSISIPICKTLVSDANGDFVLTVFVFKTAGNNMLSAPKRSYELKINKSVYGLSDNSSARKYITVDISSLGIVLSDGETLAFYKSSDTLVPGFLGAGALNTKVCESAVNMHGFLCNVGSSAISAVAGSLLYDFTFERTYENKEASEAKARENVEYAELMARLRDKYAGKKVSVLGDSISTFSGVSNNGSSNSTISGNAVYYSDARIPTKDFTYWGRLIKECGMELCVNNGYSGSRTYDTTNNTDAVHRATELDKDDGMLPDVILVYMGTNDHLSYSMGTMIASFEQKGSLDEWWAGVMHNTSNATVLNAGTTYKNFEEAYALMLYRMKQAYPNAEIYCMNTLPTNMAGFNTTTQKNMNRTIELLCNYFGATLVDLAGESGITYENCRWFSLDVDLLKAIHPNSYGHAKMMYTIAKAMDREK